MGRDRAMTRTPLDLAVGALRVAVLISAVRSYSCVDALEGLSHKNDNFGDGLLLLYLEILRVYICVYVCICVYIYKYDIYTRGSTYFSENVSKVLSQNLTPKHSTLSEGTWIHFAEMIYYLPIYGE